ncbi:MAG: FAD/NAD(P)-binding oxidoreductase [Bacteroidota bacterium]|nr:FAD/NAD(P)-binding oxidoreductase [Bacteroidota bacterium]MDP4233258.1 FAD/NAD(P)-binding oxidoreductase [Bacteroidota bacterium]MDP4242122.1 FAD/NAD(P)-binding oxidoreductase [Bacteroidota bacterium]MDP4289079.1 FAD/NAD(P)-binding oxidoreductase [Bacteroidota bacterium]
MRQLVILGAGTAGTMMANHLHKSIDLHEWQITIVDQYPKHYYQPGFLFIPFGLYSEKDVVKSKREFIPHGVEYLESAIDRIDPRTNSVMLASGTTLNYDILIIATGAKTAPEQTEGLTGSDWRKRIFDFYTFEGATALHAALENWNGGRLVVHITELPIKCPVAPLEFSFLADWWLAERGLRDKTELVYVTPLSSAFTKPICADVMGHTLTDKRINTVTDFNIARVDNDQHQIISWDGREVPYDLLVTIPTNMGDAMIERSGIGDELNFVPTDKHTLQSKVKDNIFVIGDATDVPASKAGSVAHFESEVLTKNILHYMHGEPLTEDFDGHANCYIESGFNKAFLIDFNYELEPMPGTFPLPGIGPFSLLKESYVNHLGKLAFRWIYWNGLLKARPIPGISHTMSRTGKRIPPTVPTDVASEA